MQECRRMLLFCHFIPPQKWNIMNFSMTLQRCQKIFTIIMNISVICLIMSLKWLSLCDGIANCNCLLGFRCYYCVISPQHKNGTYDLHSDVTTILFSHYGTAMRKECFFFIMVLLLLLNSDHGDFKILVIWVMMILYF